MPRVVTPSSAATRNLSSSSIHTQHQHTATPLLYWRVYEPAAREDIDRRSAPLPLGDRCADLVPAAIPPAGGIFRGKIVSQIMTAWYTLGLCVTLAASTLLMAGSGAMLLRIFGVKNASAFDTLLFSTAAGTILLELAVTAGELAP